MALTENARSKALKALDGMAEIVRNERLIRGQYIDDEFEPEMATAVCQGHRYCAIGSLWAGYGVKVKRSKDYWGEYDYALPGTSEGDDREAYLKNRPGLRAALEALNEASDAFVEENPDALLPDIYHQFNDSIEHLFENSDEEVVDSDTLLTIIANARERIAVNA